MNLARRMRRIRSDAAYRALLAGNLDFVRHAFLCGLTSADLERASIRYTVRAYTEAGVTAAEAERFLSRAYRERGWSSPRHKRRIQRILRSLNWREKRVAH